MRSTLYRTMLVAFVVGVAAGCGGSSRLSASAYRAKLATISKQADQAQAAVEQGLHAQTISALSARLGAFANASQTLGDEVQKLKPPKDAESANALLARGEHDTAAATRAALPKLARMKSVKAAIGYLSGSLGNQKGGHELDQALTELKKLGYTKGS